MSSCSKVFKANYSGISLLSRHYNNNSYAIRTPGNSDIITIYIGGVELGIVTRTGISLANSWLLVRTRTRIGYTDLDKENRFVDYEDFKYTSRLLHNGPD